MLHPLRAQLEYFVPLLRHLGGTEAEVLAVDLPGHGQSSAPSTDYTAAYFTDAVEGFLDAMDIRGRSWPASRSVPLSRWRSPPAITRASPGSWR